jgi:hypothetical protein
MTGIHLYMYAVGDLSAVGVEQGRLQETAKIWHARTARVRCVFFF